MPPPPPPPRVRGGAADNADDDGVGMAFEGDAAEPRASDRGGGEEVEEEEEEEEEEERELLKVSRRMDSLGLRRTGWGLVVCHCFSNRESRRTYRWM